MDIETEELIETTKKLLNHLACPCELQNKVEDGCVCTQLVLKTEVQLRIRTLVDHEKWLKVLYGHDWHFERSDDPVVFAKGKKRGDNLRLNARALGGWFLEKYNEKQMEINQEKLQRIL